MTFRIDGGFSSDAKSKREFIASTEAYLNSVAPSWILSWYGEDNKGNMVKVEDSSETSHLDLYLFASKGGKTKRYAIELKERIRYNSDRYGEEGDEGWIYNYEKDRWLRDAAERGFIPLYANVYPDGICRVWNILKVRETQKLEKPIHRYTVKDSEVRMQKRLGLMNNDAITYRRIWEN